MKQEVIMFNHREYLKRFNELSNYDRSKGIVKENRNQLDIVKNIVKFLNDNYKPGEITTVTLDGRVETKKVIGLKGKDDKNLNIIAAQISPLDLFYRVEEEFKNIIEKSEKRTIFLKTVIIDWFNGFDGLKNGILSKNLSY